MITKIPTLFLITGMPGAGKTTLAKDIQRRLGLPLYTKDYFKELVFDTLGWSDRKWSKKVGLASYKIMDYIVVQELQSGNSLILESNFKPEFDNEKFQKWQKKYKCKIVQVVCSADPMILFNRFSKRVKKGERHPGHVDGENLNEWRDFFMNDKDTNIPLDVKSLNISIDTNDFNKINIDNVLKEISIYIGVKYQGKNSHK